MTQPRIIVTCHGTCGQQIETAVSHQHNAMCPECRRKSNIASTIRARLRKEGKDVSLEVPTAERIKDYAYWGN